jgi:hypothetical protein
MEIVPKVPGTDGELADPAKRAEVSRAVALKFTARQFRDMILNPADKEHAYFKQLEVMAVEYLQRFEPRDPVEEMMIAQMLWAHARVANLMRRAKAQKEIKWAELLYEATDRASNLVRRQMLALAEYRRPRRRTFTAIRQANIAGQQVVTSSSPVENRNEEQNKAKVSAQPKGIGGAAEKRLAE